MASIPSNVMANPPQWLQNVCRGIQIQLDQRYANDKAIYIGAVNNWIVANVQNRDTNKPITPFTTAKPVHMIAYVAQGDSPVNALGHVEQYADDTPDPTLPEAVLPAPMKSAPSLRLQGFLPALVAEGGGTSGPSNADIWNALQSIVAALKAVGIPV